MKKVFKSMLAMSAVVALAVPAVSANAASGDSATAPEGYAPKSLGKQVNALNLVSPVEEAPQEKVLLVMNVLPWGSNAAQNTLAALGIPFDEARIDQVDDLDLTQYRMVMLASDQNNSFYSDYPGVQDELEAYVEAGGSLLFGISDGGYNAGRLNADLPGGVETTFRYEYDNRVVDTDHPVVVGGGLPTLIQGYYASHRHVDESSLPDGSNVIIEGADSGQPTLVEYPLGEGIVIATGMTWEFAVDVGYNYGNAYDDLIQYAFDSSVIDPDPDPNYLAIATALVEQAEQEQTRESVDEAQEAINKVQDGEDKEALQERLDAVKKALQDMEAANEYLDAIFDADLNSKTRIDTAINNLNEAKELYEGLPDGNGKTALGEAISDAQDVIEEGILAILETTVNGKPYILTGKQLTIMILHAIDEVEASNQGDVDRVMDYLMPIVEGHTNLSETWIRAMVTLYLPQPQFE